MKKITVALTILALLFVSILAVHAQTNGETVSLNLNFTSDPSYVNADDYVVLRHGWGACTKGLVKAYLTAVHTELTINGELVSVADGKDQHWGELREANPDFYDGCIVGNEHTPRVVEWHYPLGTLDPGEHEIHFYYWLDHPVIDGGDGDGDGKMDRFEGVITDRTFTIIVLE
jgi:hypothetical protein